MYAVSLFYEYRYWYFKNSKFNIFSCENVDFYMTKN